MKKLFSLIIICLSIIYCEKILAYNEYKIGDIINYHGVNYYVIENSDSDTNYLVLLKAFPFTQEELKTYRENDAVDIQYVDKITFIGDVKIVFKTVFKSFFKQEGISSETSATMEVFMGSSEQ